MAVSPRTATSARCLGDRYRCLGYRQRALPLTATHRGSAENRIRVPHHLLSSFPGILSIPLGPGMVPSSWHGPEPSSVPVQGRVGSTALGFQHRDKVELGKTAMVYRGHSNNPPSPPRVYLAEKPYPGITTTPGCCQHSCRSNSAFSAFWHAFPGCAV